MLITGQSMEQSYQVYDNKGNFATAYNLGLGSALALRWAKLACNELEGRVLLHDAKNPDVTKVVYQKKRQ